MQVAQTQRRASAPAATIEQPNAWAVGWAMFAGVMLVIQGCWWLIAGLIALFNDTFYVVGQEYIFQFDVTTWGWIHLILGVVVFFAGVGLFTGAVWARTVGVFLALVSAVVAFAWIPYYPFWAIMIAASAVFVIWALTAHGRDVATT
jgi:hypothetical protein